MVVTNVRLAHRAASDEHEPVFTVAPHRDGLLAHLLREGLAVHLLLEHFDRQGYPPEKSLVDLEQSYSQRHITSDVRSRCHPEVTICKSFRPPLLD